MSKSPKSWMQKWQPAVANLRSQMFKLAAEVAARHGEQHPELWIAMGPGSMQKAVFVVKKVAMGSTP